MSDFWWGVLAGAVGLAVFEAVLVYALYKFADGLRITG